MPDQSPQPLTPAQAQELAQGFHDLAVAIGQYRITKDADLSDLQQYQLQNLQLQCTQYSNNFIAEGLFAAQIDLDRTLASIKQATAQAKQAIATADKVDKALQIASAAAVLGASIASMNPAAVGSGLDGLLKAITGPAPTPAGTPPSGGKT